MPKGAGPGGWQAELQEKDLALRGIQRNYESLSSLMQERHQQVQQLQDEVEVLAAEKVDLGVRLDTALQRADRAENREMELSRSVKGEEAVRVELDKANFQISVATERNKTFHEKLKQCQEQVWDLEADKRRLQAEVQAATEAQHTLRETAASSVSEASEVFSQKQALESELRARQDAMKHLQGELMETQKALTALRRGTRQTERLLAEGEEAQRKLQLSVEESQAGHRAAEVRWAACQAQVHALEATVRTQQRSLEATQEEQARLAERLKEETETRRAAEAVLAATREAAATEKAELERRLSEAGAQYDRLVGKKAEVGGALESVARELTAVKGLLQQSEKARLSAGIAAENQQQKLQAEAKQEAAQLRQDTTRLREALNTQHWQHKEQVADMARRLDSGASRAEALEAQIASGFSGLLSSLDGLSQLALDSAGLWEEELGCCESKLERLGEQVQFVSESLIRQLSAAQASGNADRDALASQLMSLEDDLAAERGAHASVREATREKEEHWSRLLAQQKDTAARELANQRDALTAKLQGIEAEMEKLRAVSDTERASTAAEAQQTVGYMQQRVSALQAQLEAVRAKAADDLETQRAILSSEFNSQTESERQHVLRLQEKMRECFAVASALSGDVEAVDHHLVVMKIQVSPHSAGSRLAEEDGEGVALGNLLNHCRVHNAYVTETVQDMIKKFRQQVEDASLETDTQRAMLQAELRDTAERAGQEKEALRALVKRCHGVAMEISSDVVAVDKHLVDMKVTRKVQMPRPKMAMENGDGQQLESLLTAARLHFSYVTEAVQDLINRPPQLEEPESVLGPDYSEVEKELRNTVAKLVHAEASLESYYTCIKCLEIFRRPVSCIPCGHSFCLSCLESTAKEHRGEGYKYHCEECGEDSAVAGFVDNRPMEGLCAKYEYKLSALKSLQTMLKAPNRPESK